MTKITYCMKISRTSHVFDKFTNIFDMRLNKQSNIWIFSTNNQADYSIYLQYQQYSVTVLTKWFAFQRMVKSMGFT